MASDTYTVTGATGAELTGEISARDLAALEQLRLREPASEPTAAIESGSNGAVWKVYAALALAFGAFLLAVLLMATGVVATPHT